MDVREVGSRLIVEMMRLEQLNEATNFDGNRHDESYLVFRLFLLGVTLSACCS
jgi:hypothetical protein